MKEHLGLLLFVGLDIGFYYDKVS